MTDRGKLVELLIEADREIGILCDGCGARPEQEVFGNIADHLITHGVTVKQMQKPLTVKELYDRQGEIVYLEYVKNKLEEHPYLLTFFGNYYAEFDCYGGQNADFIIADYGYTWRCWANRPTEEERKAAEWEK